MGNRNVGRKSCGRDSIGSEVGMSRGGGGAASRSASRLSATVVLDKSLGAEWRLVRTGSEWCMGMMRKRREWVIVDVVEDRV